MKIEKTNIADKIFLLIFDNQDDIASTFLRFQEHYESPEFRGKIFTLNEYKEWSISKYGDFTYYKDWNGFNIPSYVLKPFYEGKFNPLSKKEKRILYLFTNVKGNFYVIGIHKNMGKLLTHEVAHGLFYIDPQYHEVVMNILSEFDLNDIKKALSSSGGYHNEVLDDEVHAHLLDPTNDLKEKIPEELHKRLLANYQKASERNKVCLPDL